MQNHEIERLKSKNYQEAIIQNICRDFNMSPIIANAYYKQMEKYFEEHLQTKLRPGQIVYEATSKEEPSGKTIKLCLKKAVILTLNGGEDLEALEKEGLSACRRKRIVRLSDEASSQGAYLTCEDLAVILTSSVSTIKRDVQYLGQGGTLVPLRGRMKDIGRATTHKAKIVALFLENYQFTEIEKITRHSEKSIDRYLKDFTQVSILIHKGLSLQEIRQVVGISKKLAQEYSLLYQQALNDSFKARKLKELLGQAEESVKKNSKGRPGHEKKLSS